METNAHLMDLQKIWDRAPHNAMTDLIRFQNTWLCVLREGADHVSPDGRIRILISDNGIEWSSAAFLAIPGLDLRDPKITETPSGGDTGYAGLYCHDSVLWVSYYSAHEQKASIYLAKVKLPQ